MRLWGVLWLLCAGAALSACAQNPHSQNTTFLDRYAEPNPTLTSFRECHGFSCSSTSRVSLNKQQWSKVAAVFGPRANNARAERRQISQAVAVMRMQVGAQTGTAVHQWTHKDFQVLPNLSDPTQLDCIDESVNTWTYMTLMERGGLLRFHEVAKLSNAGSLYDPRNTAVLKEKGGDYYAIDPTLVDAGVPPPVIPLASWLGDWPPDLSKSDAPTRYADVGPGRAPAKSGNTSARSRRTAALRP